MSPMRDGTGQTTSEDRATQLLIWETLSLAIKKYQRIPENQIEGSQRGSQRIPQNSKKSKEFKKSPENSSRRSLRDVFQGKGFQISRVGWLQASSWQMEKQLASHLLHLLLSPYCF